MKDMNLQFIQVDSREGILTVTMNRPEVLNALHPGAHHELARVFDAYAADPELRVAILTGAGERGFCVGTDLKDLAKEGPAPYPPSGFGGITMRFDLYKPIIAAINGLCLGGGVELLAACDLAIAADHAQFGLPEPLVGQAAVGGAALQRLMRAVPMKEAMKLALTAQRVDAAHALRIGMVSDVVRRGDLLDAARAMARQILACAPLSIEATKQVMMDSLEKPGLAAGIRATYPAVQRMLASQDAIEGPTAFAQKRKPRWTGA